MRKFTLTAIAVLAVATLSLTACNGTEAPEETTEDNFVYTTPPLTAVPVTDEVVTTTTEEITTAEESNEETSEETTTEELKEIPVPEDTTEEIQTLAPAETLDPDVSSAVAAGVEVKPAETEATTEQTIGAVPYETAAQGEVIGYLEDGSTVVVNVDFTGELEDGDDGDDSGYIVAR